MGKSGGSGIVGGVLATAVSTNSTPTGFTSGCGKGLWDGGKLVGEADRLDGA